MRPESVLRAGALMVALQIGERPAGCRNDVLIHRRMAQVLADQSKLLVRIAPPFPHVRTREPILQQRQIGSRHWAKLILRRHQAAFSVSIVTLRLV